MRERNEHTRQIAEHNSLSLQFCARFPQARIPLDHGCAVSRILPVRDALFLRAEKLGARVVLIGLQEVEVENAIGTTYQLQALVAVMRKLLHAIFGMFQSGREFDGSRFYRIPKKA